MSYCVNCGVKLAPEKKMCPLCGTPVINPNGKEEESKSSYPESFEEFKGKKLNRRFLIKILWVLMGISAVVSALIDFIFTASLTWSVFVLASVGYVCCIMLVFFCGKKFLSWLISVVSTLLFLLIIAFLTDGLHWFLYLVAPFTFVFALLVGICVWMAVSKKRMLMKLSLIIFIISVSLVMMEVLIDLYTRSEIYLSWSIASALPVAVFALLILILSKNKKLIEEIKKKTFI